MKKLENCSIKETESLAEQLPRVTIQEMVNYKLRYMPDWFKTHVAYVEYNTLTQESQS